MTSPESLRVSFQRAGQAQVFAFYDRLSPAEQKRLLEEAAEIDLAEIDRLNQTLVAKTGAAGLDLTGLAPAPYEGLPGRKRKRRVRKLCAKAESPPSRSPADRARGSATTGPRARLR